ncbi:nuclear transport factor 2 family protein [Chloroflexota bacterium]
MSEATGPEARTVTRELADIEAIRRLKARYFNCLDAKLWDELLDCFTAEAVLAEHERSIFVEGGEPIVGFLKQGLGFDHVLTVHHGHNAEIEITGEETARARWALNDYVFNRQTNKGSRGYGFYEDEYVKEAGEWKIRSCTVTHVHKEKFIKDG